MPPKVKRRTKQSMNVSVDAGLSSEQNEEMQLFWKDYHDQANKWVDTMEKTLADLPQNFTFFLENFLMQIPQDVCDMPIETFIECGGTIEDALDYQDQYMCASALGQNNDAHLLKSAKKKKTKVARRPVEFDTPGHMISDSGEESESSASTKVKKTKGGAKKTLPMKPPTSRAARFRTPAHLQQSLSFPNDTPLVTPAFNPRLPKTPTVRIMSATGEISDEFQRVTIIADGKKKGDKKMQKVDLAIIDFDVDNVTIPDDINPDLFQNASKLQKFLASITNKFIKQNPMHQ